MPENLSRVDTPRRRRYARSPSQAVCVSITPVRLNILRYLAELRFLSLPQIAKLCCPSARQDLSSKSARRHMRALFDAGLVDVLPVSRAALAPPGAPNDASLLYGSAPNIYTPTSRGVETLQQMGLTERQAESRKKPSYGPKNSLFLAHELAVRDVRVWLELVAGSSRHELECWQDGDEAAIDLERERAPFAVRPDAWFILRVDQVNQMKQTVLVGLVEVDRGTERGDRRWREKLEAYWALFASRRLPAVTGYVNARVLVIAPDARRRDRLASDIAEAGEDLALKFWIAEQTVLDGANLLLPAWRHCTDQQHTNQVLRPLISPMTGL